jgi:hypothetical protein
MVVALMGIGIDRVTWLPGLVGCGLNFLCWSPCWLRRRQAIKSIPEGFEDKVAVCGLVRKQAQRLRLLVMEITI